MAREEREGRRGQRNKGLYSFMPIKPFSPCLIRFVRLMVSSPLIYHNATLAFDTAGWSFQGTPGLRYLGATSPYIALFPAISRLRHAGPMRRSRSSIPPIATLSLGDGTRRMDLLSQTRLPVRRRSTASVKTVS